MPDPTPSSPAAGTAAPTGLDGLAADWSADRETFKVPWGKAMMWVFLLSDTFIFGIFLSGYMAVRMTTAEPWPNPSEVFALQVGASRLPLLLIAIMTFVLISSSGTMAMAVNFACRRERGRAAALMLVTAALGATFVGMQAFEWTKLITEGVRPWNNPLGAAQFGACFFMITGFHGLHVSAGVAYLATVAIRLLRRHDDEPPGDGRPGDADRVEIAGLYWHFVDLVWVFIFAFFYLW
ncbi:heme-copper oxidase subunit III family protein [Jeongeupia sp. USM3]|uniref:heme-copper oxidase subunit III family protein n=1 Tax=Jeongeupia sp. USM3 TaxID=1906741 RepID=UPI00089DEF2D|nr:heme-copper oxidase subunit III family protein [Jeongeupia sp. USM3]AOX99519.1 bb3-type cytochrome oxidase subunit IV [Jeongeupia sp. USM3]